MNLQFSIQIADAHECLDSGAIAVPNVSPAWVVFTAVYIGRPGVQQTIYTLLAQPATGKPWKRACPGIKSLTNVDDPKAPIRKWIRHICQVFTVGGVLARKRKGDEHECTQFQQSMPV
jgi:hypothetical protein